MGKQPQPPVPVTATTISSAMATGDDFGHEMRVKAVLQKGARVQHGWAYLDPVEAKPRQFDFRARVTHEDMPRRIHLAVEAKNLPVEAPMIVSGSTRAKEEAFHHFIRAEIPQGGRGVLNSRRDPVYLPDEFVGRSVMRVKPEGGVLVKARDTEIYDRWTQALASADDLCKEAITATDPRGRQVSTLVLPALVVPDGTLWTVEYKEDGTQKGPPAPSDSTTLFLNHEIVVVPHNYWIRLGHVHFFTLKGLADFMQKLTDKHATWEEWFPASAEWYAPPVH